MNEQRAQAYLNLIKQLLTCNQGDKLRILQGRCRPNYSNTVN
ncbi:MULTISPECIES: hypothetical protein [Microcystis]|jgi:hypothetical protein|nr:MULTISPECIES: hypothetical protein [Microcystis]MDB9429335.1 hypothetical protein [Microcystis aeruginosa CS-555/01A07]WOB69214.1 hypothetical protein PJW00_03925 [Microcystis aeruginosa LE3]